MVLFARAWDEGLLSDLTKELLTELHISPGARGGMEKYRMTLAISLFFKFYTGVLKQLTLKKVPHLHTTLYRFSGISNSAKLAIFVIRNLNIVVTYGFNFFNSPFHYVTLNIFDNLACTKYMGAIH